MTEQAEPIVIGSIVYLKSGGPAMTVDNGDVSWEARRLLECTWWSAARESMESSRFDAEAVTTDPST